jgi:SEC-C motif-containing protein
MRSRYTAYTRSEIDYLFETSGPEIRKEFDHEASRTWADSADWQGLAILDVEGGAEHDQTGAVEFLARYEVNDKVCDHHELAQFARVDGVWRFIDGQVKGPEPVRREAPKVGRNEPCPCGSGRKFKKCCAGRSES